MSCEPWPTVTGFSFVSTQDQADSAEVRQCVGFDEFDGAAGADDMFDEFVDGVFHCFRFIGR